MPGNALNALFVKKAAAGRLLPYLFTGFAYLELVLKLRPLPLLARRL